MIRPGDRVGVAVSGGSDSIALLRLLLELRGDLGITLVALHFNHRLRGAESDADEQFVGALASQFAVEWMTGCEDVAAVARTRGWNLEDAARRLRYSFFASLMKSGTVTRVAIAHTADDQAETVLARLLRGTGPAGLAAIYPIKVFPGGCVVRPLLEIRREELRDYLENLGQPWREDRSNTDTSRLRARLRHNVLPMLERELQPAIVAHLCRLADLARKDEGFWTELMAELVRTLTRREGSRLGIRADDLLAPLSWLAPSSGAGPEGGVVSAQAIARLAVPAQAALAPRMVRAIVGRLRDASGESTDADPTSDGRIAGQLTAYHIEQVLRLAVAGESGRRIEMPGIVAERSFGWIWFEAIRAETKPDETRNRQKTFHSVGRERNKSFDASASYAHAVELPPAGSTTVAVPEITRRFCLKVIDWPARGGETRQEHPLDRDLLHSPLVLRNWRPGDAFRPQGRRHAHKLKQFLRERRVARRERAGWPVLTSGDSVVWARGLPVASGFAAGEGTRAGVVVTEESW